MKVKDLLEKEIVKEALDDVFEYEKDTGRYIDLWEVYDYFYEKEVSLDVIDELEYSASSRYNGGYGLIGNVLSALAKAARAELGKKYEITEESRIVKGHVLYRIRLLRDVESHGLVFPKGSLGGFIEKEENLSQEDDGSIVLDNACVFGDALVEGEAVVKGNARVYGQATVNGCAVISERAKVFENASVSGKAHVKGKAIVKGNAHVYASAAVTDYATVYGNASLFDVARVEGEAEIRGCACIYGHAVVRGSSIVTGDSRVYCDAVIDGNTIIVDGSIIYWNDKA